MLLKALLGYLRSKLIGIVIIDGVVQLGDLLLLHWGAVHTRVGISSCTLLQIFNVFQPIIWLFAGHWLVSCDHLREGRDLPDLITVLEIVLLS